jgi:type IV pilus assembly protein PilN
MIRINLLPHREIKRKRQQQHFLITLGVVVVVGAVVWFMVHHSLTGTYEDQIKRNQYLTDEIAKLDKQIEEIKKLKEMTASLLARKKVVETLQGNRAEVVHLLDDLSRQLPDGIYLKQIKQEGTRVTINGYTQSQARVSTLMRNLDATQHLEGANLIEIKAVPQGATRINEFTLTVRIARPKEDDGKAAKTATTK